MHITRRFTVTGQDPFAAFPFTPRTSRIVNPDGSVVFELKDLLVPEHWSQVAVDILAQKYFRKAGVPARAERVAEPGVPEWLLRSVPAADDPLTGQEDDGGDRVVDARAQLGDRVVLRCESQGGCGHEKRGEPPYCITCLLPAPTGRWS